MTVTPVNPGQSTSFISFETISRVTNWTTSDSTNVGSFNV